MTERLRLPAEETAARNGMLWRILPCENCGTLHDILDLIKTGRIDGKFRRYCRECWTPLEHRLRLNETGWYFTDTPEPKPT